MQNMEKYAKYAKIEDKNMKNQDEGLDDMHTHFAYDDID
jgi:hypothetical protein